MIPESELEKVAELEKLVRAVEIAEAEIDAETVADASNVALFKRYRYWLWFALAYAFAIGLSFAIGFNSPAMGPLIEYTMLAIYSIAIATVVLVAGWSVLGPGPLWKRFVFSNACGLIVLAGLLIGFCFTNLSFMSSRDAWDGIIFGAFSFFGLTVSAQIIFWFLRGLFGWQFVYRDEAARTSVTLSEIFVIVFMFAAISATPNLANKISANRAVADLEIGSFSYEPVVQPDGMTTYEPITITAENIESIRESKIKEASQGSALGAMMIAAYATIFTLISIPIFWLMFRSKTILAGWFRSLLYGFLVLVSITLVTAIVMNGLDFFFDEMVVTSLAAAIGFVVLIAWPLAVSRKAGFRLHSNKRAKMLAAAEVAPEASQV